ncbi:conserved hypothetical protein [Pediculus humanus corporis]|uniref:SOWAHA-C winged helix-turn-helix domain-containing protein n=1 Tax=Pediculus humanus subsp. corporis TaxID=121224 RepID=E0W0Q9_PEDHC|nr:uncharacterized protein Phum_PHUM562010 [Pediculus humanus corporis]EEB19215.1 conserved hypothetical protein [Pediculus humanus corporis]
MSSSAELSFDAVKDFIILNGGKVRNHDLVKHFKKFLTKPQNRDDARNYFKEIVNEVAVIRTEGDEKYLILKRRFRPPGLEECFSSSPSSLSLSSNSKMPSESNTGNNNLSVRQPPPYRAPPPPVTPTKSPQSSSPLTPVSPTSIFPTSAISPSSPDKTNVEDPPSVPVRKKSLTEKIKKEHHSDMSKSSSGDSSTGDVELECERKISVKERMQKFNRMASESDLPKIPSTTTTTTTNNVKKKLDKKDVMSTRRDGDHQEEIGNGDLAVLYMLTLVVTSKCLFSPAGNTIGLSI